MICFMTRGVVVKKRELSSILIRLTPPDFYVCRNPAHIFPSTLFVFSLDGIVVVIFRISSSWC